MCTLRLWGHQESRSSGMVSLGHFRGAPGTRCATLKEGDFSRKVVGRPEWVSGQRQTLRAMASEPPGSSA